MSRHPFFALLLPLLLAGCASSRAPSSPTSSSTSVRAFLKKAEADITNLKSAVDRFRLDCDRYPTNAEGLGALVTAPKAVKGYWKGPYVAGLSYDPWRSPYVYRDTGNDQYSLISYGADGLAGGTGDATDIGTSAK